MYYVSVQIARDQVSHDTYVDPRIVYAGHGEVHDRIDRADGPYHMRLSAWSLTPFVAVLLSDDGRDGLRQEVYESAPLPDTAPVSVTTRPPD